MDIQMGRCKDKELWVQCDNRHCMKWRKVFCKQWKNLNKISWFCSMNFDKHYNYCDAPQEKMSVSPGETVIYSELPLGALVWAKMSGYPRWPAIISKDPFHNSGAHILRYDDGTNDPMYYHVEFLGSPRTHSWLSSSHVEVYSSSNMDVISKENLIKGKKLKGQFQKSCIEALQLENASLQERINSCVHKWNKRESERNSSLMLPIKSVYKKHKTFVRSPVYLPKEIEEAVKTKGVTSGNQEPCLHDLVNELESLSSKLECSIPVGWNSKHDDKQKAFQGVFSELDNLEVMLLDATSGKIS